MLSIAVVAGPITAVAAWVVAALATLTGASNRPFTAVAAVQVMVSLAVAVPLFVWSVRKWRRSNLVISALERHDRPGPSGSTT